MLNTVLEKLQTLFSKQFIISSFFPVMIFAFFNAVTLYRFYEPFRRSVEWYLRLDNVWWQGFYGFSFLVALAVFAYIYSTLNLFLREVLEGKHLQWLTSWLRQRQGDARASLEKEFLNALSDRDHLKDADSSDSESWPRRLRKAREAGRQTGSVQFHYNESHEAAKAIQRLSQKKDSLRDLSRKEWREMMDSLKNVVALLEDVLSQNSLAPGPDGTISDSARKLNNDHESLGQLLAKAYGEAERRVIEPFTEMQFNFSRHRLASTRMGNIAESIRYYAQSRYAMNMDFMWSRLQKILQKDEAFYTVVQDAKAQLDFMVGLVWFTILYTGIWTVVLGFFLSYTFLPFLLIWALGPLVAWCCYEIAVPNYRAFADLLRSALDLYRLDLLTAFHLPLPSDNQAEQKIWDTLNHQKCYGDQNFSTTYRHG